MRPATLRHCAQLICGVELVHAALDAAVGVQPNIDQTLGSHLGTLDPFGELIELLAGVAGTARHGDRSHIGGIVEHSEAVSLDHVGDFAYLHSEADVRLVGAVPIHGVIPAHPGQRVGNLHPEGVAEHLPHHTLEYAQHILLLHEAHLTVYLGELGLAVGTQVLVAEAPDYLEVAVVTGHHKQLLEGLGRLGQGVEGAGVHPRGHHEVARSLGSGLDEVRRLYLHEALRVEVAAHLLGEPVPERERPLQRGTAQVEIAVLRP